jgi:hypothetical protein
MSVLSFTLIKKIAVANPEPVVRSSGTVQCLSWDPISGVGCATENWEFAMLVLHCWLHLHQGTHVSKIAEV